MTTKLHCTFCGVSQDDCDVMIRGPAIEGAGVDAGICDDCVIVCAEIIGQDRSKKAIHAALGVPKRWGLCSDLKVRKVAP